MSRIITEQKEFLLLNIHAHFSETRMCSHFSIKLCQITKVLLNLKLDFILSNERFPRQYYSGFVGPLLIEQSTHLYVSLRCMHICGSKYQLYAGGGLLPESIEEQEWQETEAKMKTMRSLLASRFGQA